MIQRSQHDSESPRHFSPPQFLKASKDKLISSIGISVVVALTFLFRVTFCVKNNILMPFTLTHKIFII